MTARLVNLTGDEGNKPSAALLARVKSDIDGNRPVVVRYRKDVNASPEADFGDMAASIHFVEAHDQDDALALVTRAGVRNPNQLSWLADGVTPDLDLSTLASVVALIIRTIGGVEKQTLDVGATLNKLQALATNA